MNPELTKFLLQAAISLGGAFLAAYLATEKFRNEKWWEKKAAAYTDLIEALHAMKWTVNEHLDEYFKDRRSISDEQAKVMWEEFDQSRKKIRKVADSATFVVSSEVDCVVAQLEKDISSARTEPTYFDYLDETLRATNTCLDKIKEIGAKDLNINNTI